MAYLDELLKLQAYTPQTYIDVGLKPGQAYASYYNPYEVSAPQYTTPNAYQVAQSGYRSNEFVYSIIGKRARAIAQAPLWVLDNSGEHPEEQPKHPLVKLLKNANQNITERTFWQISQLYMDIAGFCAWEIEKNRMGQPIKLWPMRPDWCSFMRGQQQPLRTIRYQPYGLPYQDIPFFDEEGKARVLFFSNGEDFDPIYPGIRFFSPTMHALNQIHVDNAMTLFLTDFVKHGAKFAGLLSVAQTIDEDTAEDYRRRWIQAHGGTENWSNPLILGLGTTYSSMQMNFKDMAFPELDARTETRICNAFSISTIVADARAGLDVSSYNNKEQAHKSWHYEWVVPQWKDLGDAISNQMLPLYHEKAELEKFYCEFHTSEVYALVENRTEQVKRATELYKSRVGRLNEAREEVHLDPIEGPEGESFYEAVTVRPTATATINDEGVVDEGGGPQPNIGTEMPAKPGQPIVKPSPEKIAEEKHFRAFAKKRIREGKKNILGAYEFKHHDLDEQRALLLEFGLVPGADEVLEGIRLGLEGLRQKG